MSRLLVEFFRVVWVVVSFPFRAIWAGILFVYRVVAKAVERLRHRNSDVEVVDDTLSGQIADMLAIACFAACQLITGAAKWLYSVKDDAFTVGKRKVSIFAFGAKLLVIWALAVLVIGGSILLIRN